MAAGDATAGGLCVRLAAAEGAVQHGLGGIGAAGLAEAAHQLDRRREQLLRAALVAEGEQRLAARDVHPRLRAPQPLAPVDDVRASEQLERRARLALRELERRAVDQRA